MEKLSVFAVILVAACIYLQVSQACKAPARRPPPPPPLCRWSTCSNSWTGWSGSIADGTCGSQSRNLLKHTQNHSQRRHGGCPGNQNCAAARTERRNVCKCLEFKKIESGWSDWFDEKHEGKDCQKRVMNANIERHHATKMGISSCPEPVFPEFRHERKC